LRLAPLVSPDHDPSYVDVPGIAVVAPGRLDLKLPPLRQGRDLVRAGADEVSVDVVAT
jgi:hypothetical protein